jgi:hypothetical protein
MLSKKINLIGIYGRAGSGKDTIAEYLHAHFKNVYIKAFAEALKDAAAVAFGIDPETFYHRTKKEETNPFWGVSPRQIAQFFGTEMFRDTAPKLIGVDMGTNFWIHRLEGQLNGDLYTEGEGEYEDGDTVVIPDVRFQNEYDWVIENGGIVIHVVREDVKEVGIPGHSSEAMSID